MRNYAEQTAEWMRKYFRCPDEVDAHLRALKDDVKNIAARISTTCALETIDPQVMRSLIEEQNAANEALSKYIATSNSSQR